MNIEPISMTQRKLGRDGRQYEIRADVGGIVARIRELDPSLRVEYNDSADYFVILQLLDAGKNPVTDERLAVRRDLVLRVASAAWDGRVVEEMEMRAWHVRNGVSRADALDESDARRDADFWHSFEEEVKARAYPLYRTMQRIQVGSNPRAFIAKGLPRLGSA